MENVATLSWFYANRRSWNELHDSKSPTEGGYYKNEKLLKRLGLAISHYMKLQFADGSYPEYLDENDMPMPSLAATTFGMVAQADTYFALQSHGVAEGSRGKLRTSILAAANWFMPPSASHWQTPIYAFNQVAAGLAGAQRAREVISSYYNPPSREAIDERVMYLCTHGQAPAGFFHEPYGVDFGYNFTVALPDMAYLYSRVGPDAKVAIQGLVEKYMEFMSYAIISEPQTGQLSHVPALHVRNVVTDLQRPATDLDDRSALAKAFLSDVPDLAVFFPTHESKNNARYDFTQNPAALTKLGKGQASPRTWMYGVQAPDGPARAARDQVEANLPLLTSDRFTKLEDGSKNDQYLFVRRPSYYVASVFGDWIETYRSTRQLGTLWNPTMGTVLVGTNNPKNPEGWETLGPQSAFSTRQSSSTSQFFDNRTSSAGQINMAAVRTKTGLFAQRTQSAAGLAEYATGWGYWDQGLRFTFLTQRAGSCTQRLPLLLKNGDLVTFSDGSVFSPGDADLEVEATSLVLTRGGKRVLFGLGSTPRRALIKRNPSSPPTANIADGTIHRVGIIFETQIDVNIVFLDDLPSAPVQAEAHRRGNSEVSLRVTVYPGSTTPVAELRISGTAVSSTIAVPASGFQVYERTLTQVPAATTNLTVAAHAADGSVIGNTVVEIR